MTHIYIEAGKERTTEYHFVKTYLEHLRLSDFSIVCVNGKDNLPNLDMKFEDARRSGDTNIIIFDADSPANGGGFAKRGAEINEMLKTMGQEAEVFLFPNNSGDGDFETLLLQLVRREEHRRFFDCYEDYERCLGGDYLSPNRKGKVFTYTSAQKGLSRKERNALGSGDLQFANTAFWNLDAACLEPLKTFVLDNIKM